MYVPFTSGKKPRREINRRRVATAIVRSRLIPRLEEFSIERVRCRSYLIHFLRLVFSFHSRGSRSHPARIAEKEREKRAQEISRWGKVTVCFVMLVFCRAFPREIPTDRYRFIRIDLSFVLIVRSNTFRRIVDVASSHRGIVLSKRNSLCTRRTTGRRCTVVWSCLNHFKAGGGENFIIYATRGAAQLCLSSRINEAPLHN